MIPYKIIDEIHLGPIITLHAWGLFVGFGFICGTLFSMYEARRKGISIDKILNFLLPIFAGAFVGARIAFVIGYWSYYSKDFLEAFKIWAGGLSLYGGIFGALASGWIYAKITKLNPWKIADIIAPGLAFGLFIGRFGCFCIHDHMGKIMKHPMPWGIDYLGEIRHEWTLYAIINNLILFIFLWIIRKKIKKDGVLILIFLFWYSIFRFLSTFIRANDLAYMSDIRHLGMTGSQYASIILFFVSLALLFWKYKKEKQT